MTIGKMHPRLLELFEKVEKSAWKLIEIDTVYLLAF